MKLVNKVIFSREAGIAQSVQRRATDWKTE
jgi:hypothetical protein